MLVKGNLRTESNEILLFVLIKNFLQYVVFIFVNKIKFKFLEFQTICIKKEGAKNKVCDYMSIAYRKWNKSFL